MDEPHPSEVNWPPLGARGNVMRDRSGLAWAPLFACDENHIINLLILPLTHVMTDMFVFGALR